MRRQRSEQLTEVFNIFKIPFSVPIAASRRNLCEGGLAPVNLFLLSVHNSQNNILESDFLDEYSISH